MYLILLLLLHLLLLPVITYSHLIIPFLNFLFIFRFLVRFAEHTAEHREENVNILSDNFLYNNLQIVNIHSVGAIKRRLTKECLIECKRFICEMVLIWE